MRALSTGTHLSGITDWLRGSGLLVVLLLLTGVLAARFVGWARVILTRRIDKNFRHGDELVRSEDAKHWHALLQVCAWVLLAVIYFTIAIEVLRRFYISVTGLVAPATVLGAALAFGAQRVVQDLVAGFFLITERQYGYGDVVRINITGSTEAAEGTVEAVTLRITRLRNLDGELISIPNGQIIKVTNLSKDWARAVIDIPLPPSADVVEIGNTLREVGSEAFADPALKPLLLDEPTVMGVESMDSTTTNIRMIVRTLPGKQFHVRRELRLRIAVALRKSGVLTLSQNGDAT
jgi:moderate conductance mechanosensitive channel